MSSPSHLLSILTAEAPLVSYHGKQLLFFPELVVLIAALWVIGSGRLKQVWAGWRALPRNIQIGTILIFLGGAVGSLLAPELTTGLGAFKAWFCFPIAAFLLVVSFPEWSRWVLYAFMALASSEVLYGLAVMAKHHTFARMVGSFESANFLGMLIAPVLVATVLQFLESKKKLGWFVLSLLLLFGLVASRSVGGTLGVVVAGCLLLFRLRLPRLQRIGLAVLLALAVLFAGGVIMSRLHKGQANSVNSRLQIWHTSLVLGSEQPLTGIGIGNFQVRYTSSVVSVIGGPPIDWSISLPHNLFLAFWLYTGVLGLAGFLYILVEILKPAYGHWALPFVALAAHGLVDTPYFLSHEVYLFWMILAVGLLFGVHERKSRREASS